MSEWQQRTLGSLADIRVSNVDKRSLLLESPVHLCNYMDVYSNDYIKADIDFMEATANQAEIARFKVEFDDVIITKDSETPNDIGIPSVVIEDIENLVCGYHLALLKPDSKVIDSVFLCKQLSSASVAGYFARYAAGSTRYGLSNGAITETVISFPALKIQKKIATILSTIDTAIEKTEALIDKYRQIKAGLMHDLFTRGVLPNGQLRPTREQAPELYKETEIGWIPREWELGTLSSIFGNNNIVNGPFGSDLLTSELKQEGIPVIYCQDVRPGIFFKVSKAHVTREKAAQLSFCNVRKKDILLSKVGSPPCDSCVYTEDKKALVTQDVIRIRPYEGLNPDFFSSAFNSCLGRKGIKRISIEGTRERVSLGDFKRLLLPSPTFEEQDKIGSVIVSTHSKITHEFKKRDKLYQKKHGLMQDLLTGKVPVKVDDVVEDTTCE